jgi:hypothetical protein
MEETSKFQGDFAATSDGLAGSLKIMNAELANAKVAIGEELIPIQLEWVKVQRKLVIPALGEVAGAMGRGSDEIGEVADAWGRAADDSEDWGDRVTGAAEGMSTILKASILGIPGLFIDMGDAAEDSVEPTDHYKDALAQLKERGLNPVADSMEEIPELAKKYRDALAETVGAVQAAADSQAFRDFADAAASLFGIPAAVRAARDAAIPTGAIPSSARSGTGGGFQEFGHAGGVIPGMAGTNQMITAQAGERIIPRGGGGGGTTVIVNMGVVGDPYQAAQVIRDLLTQGETADGTRISGVSI